MTKELDILMNLDPLKLSEQDIDDIVSFLGTLTDGFHAKE